MRGVVRGVLDEVQREEDDNNTKDNTKANATNNDNKLFALAKSVLARLKHWQGARAA